MPWEVAPSFGIMNVDAESTILESEEKPKNPKSNLASMGVYVFTWSVLKQYLDKDAANAASKNDFGKNIIPAMLEDKRCLKAYSFQGYWKDVGTIASLWEANMDLLKIPPEFDLNDSRWPVYALSLIHILKGGGTLQGMVDMMREFQADVVGVGVMIATRLPEQKLVEGARSLLVLDHFDKERGAAVVRPAAPYAQ